MVRREQDRGKFAERVQTLLSLAKLLVSEFRQLMGGHTGPCLIGFAIYSNE